MGTISGTNAGGICGNTSNLAIMENCYSTRSSQTAIDNSTYIDGTLTFGQLNSSTFYAYGYESGTNYPKLRNFGRLPWYGYSEYNSNPTFSSVHVLVDGNLNALKINSLRVSINLALSTYSHIAPFNIANSLTIAPFNSTWVIEIFNNDLGSSSNSIELSDLSSSLQTTLINAFNDFYDTNVTSGFNFGLYQGSILASTLDLSCFCELTQILTARRGYINVKSLKVGEEVITQKGQIAKITRILNIKHKGKIVKVKKDMFGKNIPFKSFNITPDHKMCPKGTKWYYPKGKKYFVDEIKLFHIETDNYNDRSIMANGIAVETWKPKNIESKLTV